MFNMVLFFRMISVEMCKYDLHIPFLSPIGNNISHNLPLFYNSTPTFYGREGALVKWHAPFILS